MDDTPLVEVALSVYNGADHLEEFFESIIGQTFVNWRLVVRDDGSTDDTSTILEGFASALGPRVKLVEASGVNMGVVAGFSRVLEETNAPYVMCADQDDVWLPFKIKATLTKIKDEESRRDLRAPLLVFTDLIPTDVQLDPLGSSFWDIERIDPGLVSTGELVSRGRVTGCTMMVNRPLLELAVPIPPEAVTHDWWVSLIGSAASGVVPLRQPTILYRQHKSNEIGAKDRSWSGYLRRWRSFVTTLRRLQNLGPLTRRQAQAALERLEERVRPGAAWLDASSIEALREYASIDHRSLVERKRYYLGAFDFGEDPVAAFAKTVVW